AEHPGRSVRAQPALEGGPVIGERRVVEGPAPGGCRRGSRPSRSDRSARPTGPSAPRPPLAPRSGASAGSRSRRSPPRPRPAAGGRPRWRRRGRRPGGRRRCGSPAAGKEWFTTQYMVKDDGPIKSAKDLKGGTVAVVGIKTATDLWARAAILNAGLVPDKDVK